MFCFRNWFPSHTWSQYTFCKNGHKTNRKFYNKRNWKKICVYVSTTMLFVQCISEHSQIENNGNFPFWHFLHYICIYLHMTAVFFSFAFSAFFLIFRSHTTKICFWKISAAKIVWNIILKARCIKLYVMNWLSLSTKIFLKYRSCPFMNLAYFCWNPCEPCVCFCKKIFNRFIQCNA